MAERARVREALPWAALLLTVLAFTEAANASEFKIFFSRAFPGSVPEYFEVLVESSGKVSYREHLEEDPLTFEISLEEIGRLLERVKSVDYFRVEVASDRKVAFTGDKTLRYEGSEGGNFEVRFNHTENLEVRELVQWFHRVSETERHLIELERTAQFDRLGVNKTLLFFQVSLDKNRVIAPRQFLPILNQIANDKKILHIARSRAVSLVERIEKSER